MGCLKTFEIFELNEFYFYLCLTKCRIFDIKTRNLDSRLLLKRRYRARGSSSRNVFVRWRSEISRSVSINYYVCACA